MDAIQVVMLGGRLRHENKYLVGPIAEQTLEGLWFDQLFLGASAVQPDGYIAPPNGEEARLNASMLRRATGRLLLVDASKFGRHGTYRVAPLTEAWRARLTQAGVPFAALEAASDEG